MYRWDTVGIGRKCSEYTLHAIFHENVRDGPMANYITDGDCKSGEFRDGITSCRVELGGTPHRGSLFNFKVCIVKGDVHHMLYTLKQDVSSDSVAILSRSKKGTSVHRSVPDRSARKWFDIIAELTK